MEEISLVDAQKAWRDAVDNMGCIPDQRYMDCLQEICQTLTTAFAPSDDPAVASADGDDANGQSNVFTPTTDNLRSTEAQPANTMQATGGHTVQKQTTDEKDAEMTGVELQANRVTGKKDVTQTQDAKMQDSSEKPAGGSRIDLSVDDIDEAIPTSTETAGDSEQLSSSTSLVHSAAQDIAATTKPSPSPATMDVRPPFYRAPLKPAYTKLRALCTGLIYQDRFFLLSSPGFLRFLSEHPRVSHAFLQYLARHPFGTRYAYDDGSDANQGITPFRWPFLPVRRDLPLSSYYDYRWALLNEAAWLWWVSKEEFIMASFWAQMAAHGGLGLIQRRNGDAEREVNSAFLPV